MKKHNYYNKVRILALIALILSAVLVILYSAISLTNTETMDKYVEITKELIEPIFGNEIIPVEKIVYFSSDKGSIIYCGDDSKLQVDTFPKNATKDFIYSTDDSRVTITEDGIIINNCLEQKQVYVTVTSKADPSVSLTLPLYCYGINPDDERIERIEANIALSQDSAENLSPEQIYATRVHYLNCYAIIKPQYLNELGLTPENNRIKIYANKSISTEKENIVMQAGSDIISFKHAGDDTVSISFLRGNGEIFERKLTDLTFSAIEKEGWDLCPNSPLSPKNNIEIEFEKIKDNEYKLSVPADINQFSIYAHWETDVNALSRVELDGDFSNIVIQKGTYFQRQANQGKFTVKLISLLDESLVTLINVEFESIDPGEFSIYCPEKQSFFEDKITFQYSFEKNLSFTSPVRVEVIEGNDVISVDENGKNMRVHKFGAATIRFISVDFPEKYIDKQINIVFIADLNNFISKIMGHFTVFFLLGLGFTCSFVLLSKRKKLSVLYVCASLFIFSCLTELFQSSLFNNDRGSSFTDVIFNFICGLVGVAVALSLLKIFLTILKKKAPNEYSHLTTEANELSFKTVFKKNN